jgi:type IV pilus assembly protein PilX
MHSIPSHRRQQGAVLIVALVLLLVLTVLGTAGIRDTVMEERMAGNFRDYATALEAAETALRDGEGGLASTTTFGTFGFDGTDGTYDVASSTRAYPEVADDYDITVDSATLTTADGDLLVSRVPEYYLEKLPATTMGNSDLSIGTQNQPPKVHYYRVTAKGFGTSKQLGSDGRPVTSVVLQSTFFTWNGN